MLYRKIVSFVFILLIVGACSPASVSSSSPVEVSTAPAQIPSVDQVIPEEVTETLPDPAVNESQVVGSYFSGQGPSSFPIVKEPGPVLLHLRVENCNTSIILSKKGQNIPYMASKVVASDQFDDQFQFFNEFYGEPDREQTIILDNPTPYDNFGGAPPHTEVLRIQEVSNDCKWELTLLPISVARTLSPGEIVTGSYAEVFLPANNLSGMKLLFMNPDHEQMLQHFSGMFAVFPDGHAQDLMPEGSDYFEFSVIPPGTQYIEIFSSDYWEIEGS